MSVPKLTKESMHFMVWVIELVAEELFCNDKGAAYGALKGAGVWDFIIETYETTHTMGHQALLDEIKQYLECGVLRTC